MISSDSTQANASIGRTACVVLSGRNPNFTLAASARGRRAGTHESSTARSQKWERLSLVEPATPASSANPRTKARDHTNRLTA